MNLLASASCAASMRAQDDWFAPNSWDKVIAGSSDGTPFRACDIGSRGVVGPLRVAAEGHAVSGSERGPQKQYPRGGRGREDLHASHSSILGACAHARWRVSVVRASMRTRLLYRGFLHRE